MVETKQNQLGKTELPRLGFEQLSTKLNCEIPLNLCLPTSLLPRLPTQLISCHCRPWQAGWVTEVTDENHQGRHLAEVNKNPVRAIEPNEHLQRGSPHTQIKEI